VGCLGLVCLLGCGLFGGVFVLGESLALPQEDTWGEVASMQQARCHLGAVVVEGKIYAIGGRSELGVVGTVEVYDPVSNNWTYKTPMPTPRWGFAAVCFMGKIYCIGGSVDYTQFTDVVEVYDPATDSWENRTSMIVPRAGVPACHVNGQIYVMGGFRYVANVASGFWQIYDPLEDIWVMKDASWPEGCACVVLNDKIYALGRSEFWIYDISRDIWKWGGQSKASSLDTSMVGVRGVMAREAVYVYEDCLDVYFPASKSWVRGADLPLGLRGVAVVELDDQLYVLGGFEMVISYPYRVTTAPVYSYTYFGSVFVYTPFGYEWVAPEVSILSLVDGGVYDFGDVLLEFSLDRSVVWMGYSLDGGANVTVGGNVTLSGLSGGCYSVVVFVEDVYGFVGVSDVVVFSVVSAPVSLLPVVGIVGAVVVVVVGVVVCGCLLFLFLRKRRLNKLLQIGGVDGVHR